MPELIVPDSLVGWATGGGGSFQGTEAVALELPQMAIEGLVAAESALQESAVATEHEKLMFELAKDALCSLLLEQRVAGSGSPRLLETGRI